MLLLMWQNLGIYYMNKLGTRIFLDGCIISLISMVILVA